MILRCRPTIYLLQLTAANTSFIGTETNCLILTRSGLIWGCLSVVFNLGLENLANNSGLDCLFQLFWCQIFCGYKIIYWVGNFGQWASLICWVGKIIYWVAHSVNLLSTSLLQQTKCLVGRPTSKRFDWCRWNSKLRSLRCIFKQSI